MPWRHLKSPDTGDLGQLEHVLRPGCATAQRVALHRVPRPGTGLSVDPTALTVTAAAAVGGRMRIDQRDEFNDLA